LLFVDDLLICCENEEVIVEIKNKLSERFRIKDMGKVKNYICIEIKYNYSKENVLTLSQKSYIESLAKRYGIENSTLFKTPMEVNLILQQCDINENVNFTKFREMLNLKM